MTKRRDGGSVTSVGGRRSRALSWRRSDRSELEESGRGAWDTGWTSSIAEHITKLDQ